MAHECHVTCGTSTRILNLKDDDDLTKVFFILKYDNEWEDWIDVSDVGDLPLCAKLKVEVKPSFSLHSFDDAANPSAPRVDTLITLDNCANSRSDLLKFILSK